MELRIFSLPFSAGVKEIRAGAGLVMVAALLARGRTDRIFLTFPGLGREATLSLCSLSYGHSHA
jgi:hypothetical protein